MGKKLSFENIIYETLSQFPEYKQTEHYEHTDHILQYSFFFGFTSYIMDKINGAEVPESDPEVKRAFELFNTMIESEDENLSTLGVVEVLETLVQEKKSKQVAEKLLRDAGQKYLQEVLKFTGQNGNGDMTH